MIDHTGHLTTCSESKTNTQSPSNAAYQSSTINDVSIEVWQMIFEELKPSPQALARLSFVCRAFRDAAESHPRWRFIANKAGLKLTKSGDDCCTGGKRPLEEKTWKSVVVENINTICTGCLANVDKDSLRRACDWAERFVIRLCLKSCFPKKWKQTAEEMGFSDYEDTYKSYLKLKQNWIGMRLVMKMKGFTRALQKEREEAVKKAVPQDQSDKLEDVPHYSRFVDYGFGSIQDILDAMERNNLADEDMEDEDMEPEDREELLSNELKNEGLELRDDSKICDDFIWRNEESYSLVKVVEIMKEMKWFFEKTTYESDRVVTVEDSEPEEDEQYDDESGDDYSGEDYSEDSDDSYGYYRRRRYYRPRRRRTARIDSNHGKETAIGKLLDKLIAENKFSFESLGAPKSLWPYIKDEMLERVGDILDEISKNFIKVNPNGRLEDFWQYAETVEGADFCELIREPLHLEAFDESEHAYLIHNMAYILSFRNNVYLD